MTEEMTQEERKQLVKKIKRCPVCGSRPTLMAYLTCPLDAFVRCERCGREVKRTYRSKFWSEEKAVEEWNKWIQE